MRNRWNIRVLHLPDPTKVPFSCHICDIRWTIDVSLEHQNLLINRIKDQTYCVVCRRGTGPPFWIS